MLEISTGATLCTHGHKNNGLVDRSVRQHQTILDVHKHATSYNARITRLSHLKIEIYEPPPVRKGRQTPQGCPPHAPCHPVSRMQNQMHRTRLYLDFCDIYVEVVAGSQLLYNGVGSLEEAAEDVDRRECAGVMGERQNLR